MGQPNLPCRPYTKEEVKHLRAAYIAGAKEIYVSPISQQQTEKIESKAAEKYPYPKKKELRTTSTDSKVNFEKYRFNPVTGCVEFQGYITKEWRISGMTMQFIQQLADVINNPYIEVEDTDD